MKSSTFELGLRDALQNKTRMARICLYTARSISFFSWVSRGARATRAASAIARVINFFLARCKWRAKNKERLPRIYFVSDSLRLSHDLECTSHDHLFLEYWPLKSLPTADCPSDPTKIRRDWVEFTFAKTSGTVTSVTRNKDREKIGQQLTSASPITIPETIVRRISAPVPFSYHHWKVLLSNVSLRFFLLTYHSQSLPCKQ